MPLKKVTQISLTICLCSALTCVASDYKREAEFASDIQKTLTVGRAVWLDSAGKNFLGLYADTARSPRDGLIILLHDVGGHANQKGVIQYLREFLPEHNWATLSLQMPLREASASPDDYLSLLPESKDRILAGLKFARDVKAEKIVIIGYGLGALMASNALKENGLVINGLITISLPVSEENKTLSFISKYTSPMLDIYGEWDLLNVVMTARDRQVAGKENKVFRQIELENEGHLFSNDSELLVKRIYSWLTRIISNQGPAGPPDFCFPH